MELLKAGINVYTTVNVQHMESLNDVVAQITSVRVNETVPDSVLEQADATVSSYEADVALARSRFTAQQALLSLGRILGRWPTANGGPLPTRKDHP